GRRRIFIVGLIIFTIASLVCGLANSAGVLVAARAVQGLGAAIISARARAAPLVAARAVQGLGAAIISPAALSIVTTTFEEGAERNKALGIWGALGGSGAAAGGVFGGGLTQNLGWGWGFGARSAAPALRPECCSAGS